MIDLIKNIKVITVEEGNMQEIEIDGEIYLKKKEIKSASYLLDGVYVNSVKIDWGQPEYMEMKSLFHEDKPENKASKLLEASQDNNVLIGLYDESNRGIGKTSELIKLAHKEEAVMVVGSLQRERLTRAYADSLGLNIVLRATSNELETRCVRLKNNKFVVDEDVPFEAIKGLINGGNKLIGGFINLQKAFEE